MASWLNSRLKAAEQILNQIDQRAADSLGSQEKPTSEQDYEAFLPVSSSNASFDREQHPANAYQSSARVPDKNDASQVSVSSSDQKEFDWTQMLALDDRTTSRSSNFNPERKPNSKRVRAQKKKLTPNKISVEKQGEKFVSVDLGPPETDESNESSQQRTSKQDANDELELRSETEPMQTEKELHLYKAAIGERESVIRKLESEKEALEKLVAERAEQQKKEAAELKTSMAELIQATDLEKQRHNHTRIEALARESALQNESVESAKKLAAAQRILDTELAKLVESRTKVEIKRVSVSELERKLFKLRNPPSVQKGQYVSSFGEERQKVLQDIDYYKSQLKNIQEEIVSLKTSQQMQSDREKELETRLIQLTDHLIHKQSQVESLSTEKATLIFRLETLASQEKSHKNRMTDDFDVEFGTSTPEPMFGFVNWYTEMSDKLDDVFIRGSRMLGMNRMVRAMAAAYITLLHGWVLFVVLRAV